MTVSVPNFIIHASGSLGGVPDLGKRPYRLHCRFRVGAKPSQRWLEKATETALEQFVTDMALQGREFIAKQGVKVTFKGAHIAPMGLDRPKRPPSSQRMLPEVMQGAKFRSSGEPRVMTVPHFSQSEYWDYDLSCVFLCDTIVGDVPYPHEEKRPS